MVWFSAENEAFIIIADLTGSCLTLILDWWLTFTVASLLFIFVYFLWKPLNRVRTLEDVGYQYIDDLSGKRLTREARRGMVQQINRRRQAGNLPPVYPNGWFSVAESDKIKTGQVLPVEAVGNDLAVFRDDAGVIHVLDAYCPHLGAHLGVAGIVKGDCLECPFHAWQFSGHDGKCTSIPYAKKIPDFAHVKHWLSHEANGYVFIWFHAEGEDPRWWPEPIPEIMNGKWSFRGRSEHCVNAHIQEIPENGADIQHFGPVHESIMLSGIDLRFVNCWFWGFARHSWNASWNANDPPNSHSATLHVHHELRLWNKFSFMHMDVEAKQIGPGYVELRMQTPLGPAVLLQTVTPIEPLTQKVVHRLYTQPTVITPYAKLLIWSEALMIERDMMIWNNKRYENKPLLVKEDNAILRHRRWYSQFYSENSPKVSFRKDGLDW